MDIARASARGEAAQNHATVAASASFAAAASARAHDASALPASRLVEPWSTHGTAIPEPGEEETA